MLSRHAELTVPPRRTGRAARQPWFERTSSLAVPTWLLLIFAVGASSLVRILLAGATAAPWVIPDEFVYSELARSVADSGHFAVRGEPFSPWSFGPLYPLVIASVYALVDSIPQAYALVKALNCVLFSSAAVPAYLLARRLLDRGGALVAAGLAVVIPSALYTTMIMTESLSYPAFLVAMLAIVAALERPTMVRQLLALVAIGIASLTRAQLAVLLPAFVTAIVLLVVVESRWPARSTLASGLKRFRVTWTAVALGLVGLVLLVAAGPAGSALAGSRDLPLSQLGFAEVARSFVDHLAIADLYLGVIPLAAFAVVAVTALAVRQGPRSLRVFAAASFSALIWLLVVAAVYLSSLPATEVQLFPVYDRYVFYVAPLCLTALVVWIQQGLPRPPRVAGVVGSIVVLLPPILALTHVGHAWGTSSSTVAIMPWLLVRSVVGPVAVVIGITAVCTVLTALFLRASRPVVIMAVVVLNLVLMSQLAYAISQSGAARAARLGVGADPAWVDAAASGEEVVAIWSGSAARGREGRHGIWQNDLFNRSVGRVFHLREPLRYGPPGTRLASRRGVLHTANGQPLRAPFVLTDRTVPVAAERIASDARTGMVLYRTNGVVRLRGTRS
jgi:Dolichyl-phosphate-mannose-protein mannosyltransferase